jgi:hypothetical protein
VTGAVACILEMPGIDSQPVIRGNVGEYVFQVLAVSKQDYWAARDMAWRIHRFLADQPGVDLPNWTVCVIDAETQPQPLAYDERVGREFSASYAVRAYEKAPWAAV